MFKDIIDNDILYARIIRSYNSTDETIFFTRPEDELQIGVLSYESGYKTGAHCHNRPQGFLNETDEIIIVQKGSARVDFYNDKGSYIKSSEIFEGDIIIIYIGGHSLTYGEKSKILIVKKGPYNDSDDKTRIVGVNNFEINIDN